MDPRYAGLAYMGKMFVQPILVILSIGLWITMPDNSGMTVMLITIVACTSLSNHFRILTLEKAIADERAASRKPKSDGQ